MNGRQEPGDSEKKPSGHTEGTGKAPSIDPGGPRIFVDEDWKAQVEREKREQLEQERREPSRGPAAAASERSAGGAEGRKSAYPPPSFDMLLTTLATEALVALGEIPHPASGKSEMELDHAHYLIDTLEMLREKTRGNLSGSESQAIEAILHQLRLAYVARSAGRA